MSGWSKWRIRGKLFFIILFILVAHVVVLLFSGSHLFARFYISSKQNELKESAGRITMAYQENSEAFYEEIRNIENKNTLVTLAEIGEDGELNITYFSRMNNKNMRPGARPDMPAPPEEDQAFAFFQESMKRRFLQAQDGYVITLGQDIPEGELTPEERKNFEERRRDAQDRINLSAKLDNTLYLNIETPLDYIKSTADLAVSYTGILSIVILLIGAVLIYFIVGRVTTPILKMQGVADKISRLDFSRRCDVKGGDEIAMLGESINNMSEKLEASISKLVQANEVLQNDLVRQQQTDRMRREFIANVSHDFKTPLTLIISYAEALAEECGGEHRQEYCEILINEGNKLSGMVGKLLNLSKLESGVDSVTFSVFCLAEVMDEVLKDHRILAKKRNITVVKQIDNNIIVNADYGRIQQVVTNLFENAVKYANEGGEIRVKAWREEATCYIAIENTGFQIDPEDMENLFDSFYRGDKARGNSRNSFGLGLAIVKAVMVGHHQPYGVENITDGVRFWFRLECYGQEDDDAMEEEG